MREYEQELQKKTALAIETDATFKDFGILWRPEDARVFTRQSAGLGSKVDERVLPLLSWIDQTIPPADPGKYVHAYRIGREVGKRVLWVEVPTAKLPGFDFEILHKTLDGFAMAADALLDIEDSDHHFLAKFLWA